MENFTTSFDKLVTFGKKSITQSEKSFPIVDAISNCRVELQKLYDVAKNSQIPADSDIESNIPPVDMYKEVYKLIMDALAASEKVEKDIGNKDQSLILQSGLSLILISADFFPRVGSVNEDVGLTICQLLLNVFSLSKVEGETLPSKLRSILRSEFEKLQLETATQQELHGCLAIAHNIMDELILHQQQYIEGSLSAYEEFSTSRLDVFINILGQLKFLSEKEFSTLSEEIAEDNASADVCLSAIGAYANLAGFYIMILSWHLALANVMKLNSALLAMKLKNAKQEATEFLKFLSNKDLLGPAGWWLGKLRLMKQFREHPRSFASIENIRISLGLSPTSYSSEEAASALDHCLRSSRSKLNPEMDWTTNERKGEIALEKNENHSLCIINKTPFTVGIFPGIVSNGNSSEQFADVQRFVESNVDELLFPINKATHFSTSGILALGCYSGGLSRAPAELKDVGFIEFGLSCQRYVSKKIFTNPIEIYSKEHLKETSSSSFKGEDDVKCFTYHNRMYMVQGRIQRGKKNEWALFQFCIEEFDADKLIKHTVKIA